MKIKGKLTFHFTSETQNVSKYFLIFLLPRDDLCVNSISGELSSLFSDYSIQR